MKYVIATMLLVFGVLGGPKTSYSQTYYLSEILTLATFFCPAGTLPADGRLLPIYSYAALFNLLGTDYGGDGTTTFGLPYVKPVLTANRHPLTACVVTSGVFPVSP